VPNKTKMAVKIYCYFCILQFISFTIILVYHLMGFFKAVRTERFFWKAPLKVNSRLPVDSDVKPNGVELNC